MALPITLPDGRYVVPPDGLSEEELELFKEDFAKKYPLPVSEESVAEKSISETPLSTEPPLISDDFWQSLPPNLRPKEFVSEGDPFLEQVKAGAASTIQGMQTTFDRELGLKNLAALKTELDEAEVEYNELKLKEESGTISDEEKKKLQELHIKINGTQKPSGIPEMFPGQPISSAMIGMEEKSRKGLKQNLEDLHEDFRRIEKVSEETEVSDSFKWVIEQSHGEPGLRKGVKKAFSTFWNDLDRSQKGDFMGDLLGRSAVATSAILGTAFGVGALLRNARAIPQIGGQLVGTGTVSGGIEYSHSVHEYLKAKGMDTTNLDSIDKFVNDPEMMEEANDYALKRGAIIGSIDGITGGIATRIIAPATITRSHRSVMPFIKKPVGVPVSNPTQYGINFLAQTPIQTTLPAGAEYFAQLATLEEGEKISYGEVLGEALGEAAFVPADMGLGILSSTVRFARPNHLKQEAFSDVIEQVQNIKKQGVELGLEELAGRLEIGEVIQQEATVTTPLGTELYDTGIPLHNALPLYLENPNISVEANTGDTKITAPNQFFVRSDGQGGFEIVDTFTQKIGESYETIEEATETSGALNKVYAGVYANKQKSDRARMQGLNVDEEKGGFVNSFGNQMLNPYLGQLEIEEIRENILDFNPAAYERLINAIGEDATGVDAISIINDLSNQDFDALMNKKAVHLNPNVPKNVTAKMFENLKKRINVEVNVNSNAFKSLALKLTGEPNINKMSNPQKRLVYAFLTSLPVHEGTTISLPDFSPRPYSMEEYNRVVDSLNAGNIPNLSTIAVSLGLNPQDVSSKRVATRLREDLVSAGIVDKRGSKYKFNKNGDWSLLRAQQVANATDPQTQEEQEEIRKFRNYAVEELNRMGLNDIALRLDTAIQERQGQTTPDADGAFDPVWKEIFLALGKAKEGATSEAEVLSNLIRTLGHEGIHAIRFLDLFSQTEWNNLVNYIVSTPIGNKELGELIGTKNVDAMKEVYPTALGKNPTYFEAIDFRYKTMEGLDINVDTAQEEAVALLFEHYLDQKKNVAGQPRAFLERIKKFFTAINNGLNDAGYQTYDDIFDKIVNGTIGERERTDQTKKPVIINLEDSQGRPAGTYEVQPRAVRTPRIMQDYVGFLQTATGVGNIDSDDYIGGEADVEMPIEFRPLKDAPNLRFKLSDVVKRPTTVMSEFIAYARQQKYGNDITQIPLALFDQTIADDTRLKRNYGRRLSDLEIKDAQQQLYYYSQKRLKQMGYSEPSNDITLYLVGNIRKKSALTPSLIEAQAIADGRTLAPFSVQGDPTSITEFTIKRSAILMTTDVMFAMRPPAWLVNKDTFFIVGNNSLVGGTEVAYDPVEPTVRYVKTRFNTGTPVTPPTAPIKPTSKIKYKLTGLTGDLFDLSSGPIGQTGSERFRDVFNVFNKKSVESSLNMLKLWVENQELTEDQVDKAAQEIMDITQKSLVDFPDKIRVYRGSSVAGAEILSDQVVPVTLSPEVAKSFAFARKIDRASKSGFGLQSWLIDKSEVLINVDAFQPLGYWENELIVNSDSLITVQETAEAQGNLDYVNYTTPETLDRVRNIVAEYTDIRKPVISSITVDGKRTTKETLSQEERLDERMFSFNFPFNFFPEASASETMLREMGETALAGSPEYLEKEKTVPRNTYRFPYGDNFAEYMAQPEPSRRGKWIRKNLKRYPTPAYRVGQKDVKYKLGYTMEHRPNPDGPQAHKMVGEESFAPDDVLISPNYYMGSLPNTPVYDETVEAISKLQNIQENPRALISVYRSSPVEELNNGDWVSLSSTYAEESGFIEDNPVFGYEVEARELRWSGDALEEWGYFGDTTDAVSSSLDLETRYKLSYPTTDQEFIKSKTNLSELLNSGVEPNDLMEHPAIVEGLRRMHSLPVTIEKYQQRYGENWVINPAYANNREFVIDGKKVKGVRNVIDATIKKAESYADGKVGNNKIAWYFLGPPASGKSYFAEAVARDKNLAIIDSDDVKRFIPEYGDGTGANAVHKEASMLAMVARKKMLAEGKDILIPRIGAVGKRQLTLNQMRELKELGYTVNTVVVDVSEPVVQSRMYLRFTSTGRLVPPSYIAEIGNTPIDTYHRVKYLGDGFAWIDNNGRQQEEIIREDTGILPSTIGRERRNLRSGIRETGETPIQEVIPEIVSKSDDISIQEAIEGAKGINERMVSAGLVPKFNLNASADAIYMAYRAELKKPEADIIPQSLRTKYSLKSSGKKLNDKAEALIKKVTIRDKMDDSTIGEKILDAAKGIDETFIREQLVDRYARFADVSIDANKKRRMKDDMDTANISANSALMLSDRSGEIFKSALMEGVPVYDESSQGGKGYIRVEDVSTIDGKPIDGPLEFLKPAFTNPQLLWAFQAVRIAKREKRFNAEGKPVKTSAQDRKDAKKLLKDYPILKEMSDAYDRWDANVVQFLVDTGVLDKSTAKIWTANADYFPFYRMVGVDKDGKQLTKGPNIFRGLSLGKSIFTKAKGSKEKDIVDPITGIAQNLRAAIMLGMKNVAANRVVRDLLELGPNFAEQVSNNTSGSDIIRIRVGGKFKSFRVADVNILEAFQNFEGGLNTFSGFMYSLLRVPKEAVSALITRTPDFWVRQVVRDSVSAWALLGGRWLPLLTSIKNWGRIWAGLIAARLPFGLDVDIMPEGFHKLRRAGVIAGYDNVVKDIDRTDKLIKNAYRQEGINNRSTPTSIAMIPFDIIRGLWEFAGQGTLSSDAATRLAVYEDILRETGNEAEAIYQAMEVLNFTRRGKSNFMQLMAVAVPFQNPRLQGVDVFYRGITGRYGKRGLTRNQKIAGTALRFGALMSLTPLYWLAVKDSDEYKEATEEVRDNYWIVPGSKNFTGETIGVPTPFEVGLLVKTVPENIIRYYAEDQTSEDFWDSMKRNMGSTLAINPFQAPLIKTVTEAWANYNFFTGQPVVPHYMQSLAKELQYRPSTNNLFTKIGQETRMSPLKIENSWKGLTGTYGVWFATSLDGLLRENLDLPSKRAMRIDEKPLIGSLLLPPEMRGLENEFYELQDTVTNLIQTMNQMEKRALNSGDPFAYNLSDKYRIEYRGFLQALNSTLEQQAELLSQSRDKEAEVLRSNILSAQEKTEQLTGIQATRNIILKDARRNRINLHKELDRGKARP